MKRQFLTSLILLLAVTLAACGPAAAPTSAPLTPIPTAAPTAAPISSTDGLGREVTLPAPALRIVSMTPANTEILFALGAGSQVVGRDELSDTPAEAKDLPSIGGSYSAYNFEQIAALQPDLVIAGEINTPEQVKSLEDLNIPVYYLPNPVELEDLYTNINTIGLLIGRQAEASALVDSLRARQQAVVDAVAGAETVSVFYELDGSDAAKPWTSGPGTFLDKLVSMAGGVNVAGSLQSSWAQMSLEDLLVADPDFILLGDAAYGTTAEAVAARPGWGALSAVKTNQIVAVDDNLFSRPGPRMIDGLELLASILHPDLYKK